MDCYVTAASISDVRPGLCLCFDACMDVFAVMCRQSNVKIEPSPTVESEIMAENWDLEAKARPEAEFNLQCTTSRQYTPKQSYLKYLKTVHGGEMAAKTRSQLNYLKVDERNFYQWWEESLSKAIHKMENPPKNLLKHHH